MGYPWLFSRFRKFHQQRQRARRHQTPAGSFLLIGLVTTAIFGIDTRLSLIYQLFALLLTLFLFALISGFLFRGQFSVRRQRPSFVTVGTPALYTVTVRNLGQTWQRDLTLMDTLSDTLPTWEEFQEGREPGEERRNRFDRKIGFHRYQWLARQKAGGRIPHVPIPPVPPYGEAQVTLTIDPLRRGRIHWKTTFIARTDPLGLRRALQTFDAPDSLVILPKLYQLPRGFQLPGGLCHQPGGVTLARSVGESGEFVGLREYREGDALRRIHWASWARTGKPVVKEHQEEYFARNALVLDTFPPFDANLFEEAVSVAASFALTVDTGESLLDLLLVGHAAYRFTAGRGVAHADHLLEVLAEASPCRTGHFADLEALVLQHAAQLSGVLLVFLSWDAQRRHLVEALNAMNRPLLVLLLVPNGVSLSTLKNLPAIPPEQFRLLETGHIPEQLAAL